MIMQIVSAFECFSVGKQQIHGSLDLHSIYLTEVDDYLRVQLDISNCEAIRKNLKQDPTHALYGHNSKSYNQFKQK